MARIKDIFKIVEIIYTKRNSAQAFYNNVLTFMNKTVLAQELQVLSAWGPQRTAGHYLKLGRALCSRNFAGFVELIEPHLVTACN